MSDTFAPVFPMLRAKVSDRIHVTGTQLLEADLAYRPVAEGVDAIHNRILAERHSLLV